MKFKPIEDYIKLPLVDRKSHIDLKSKCVEIGGKDSRHYRGLLAWHLGTTIPNGMKIHLCHACNNHSCSNPNHLYWGTAKENTSDTILNGKWKSIYDSSVAKYGKEYYYNLIKDGCSRGGKASKGKTKYTDEKKNEIKQKISGIDLSQRGSLLLVATKLSCTTQHAGRILKKVGLK